MPNYILQSVPFDTYQLEATFVRYGIFSRAVKIDRANERQDIKQFNNPYNSLDEVLVSGTMKKIFKLDNPIQINTKLWNM